MNLTLLAIILAINFVFLGFVFLITNRTSSISIVFKYSLIPVIALNAISFIKLYGFTVNGFTADTNMLTYILTVIDYLFILMFLHFNQFRTLLKMMIYLLLTGTSFALAFEIGVIS